MTVWFTSDPHFMHEKIAQIRGFESAAKHDELIRERWTKQIRKGDSVFVLGDLTVSKTSAALEIIGSLPGAWHLIAGNHDAVHPMHRYAYKQHRRYLEVFESVQAFARRRVRGQDVLLSHFPYHVDHTADIRYTQYRLRDEGRWLIHGHTHSKEKQRGKEIHVGVDAWDFELVPLETISDLMAAYDAATDAFESGAYL